jgi:thioredoxin 2
MSDAIRLTCTACGQANRLPKSRLGAGPKCATCGNGLITGKVAELDPAIHSKVTRLEGLPVVVDYWAPWCGPCRMMAPSFSQAAVSLKGKAIFAKINTQDYPEVSQKLDIRGIPLLILYANGREVGRLSGARPAADIEQFVRSHPSSP